MFLAVALASCGEAKAACGEPFAEKIDANSSQHLLPGAEEPKYKTNPPTSGAHRRGGIEAGVSDLELDKPTQVNILESGDVLIQYNEELDESDLDGLRSFAGENVVVAPNSSLKKKIVATAWLHKMECDRIDFRALQAFIDDQEDKAPSH